jgi:hypothetical protein
MTYTSLFVVGLALALLDSASPTPNFSPLIGAICLVGAYFGVHLIGALIRFAAVTR